MGPLSRYLGPAATRPRPVAPSGCAPVGTSLSPRTLLGRAASCRGSHPAARASPSASLTRVSCGAVSDREADHHSARPRPELQREEGVWLSRSRWSALACRRPGGTPAPRSCGWTYVPAPAVTYLIRSRPRRRPRTWRQRGRAINPSRSTGSPSTRNRRRRAGPCSTGSTPAHSTSSALG